MSTNDSKSGRILLKGGTAILHSSDNSEHLDIKVTDILLEGGKITKIAPVIEAPAGVQIIDCKGKIISPGFVDTHHHLWQTLLKGRHANDTLLDYMASGNLVAGKHTAEDIFWAELAGCAEAIYCGTTTVLDFAHVNVTPEHNARAIDGAVASGLRTIYCFAPSPYPKSWEPFELEVNALAGHTLPNLDQLVQEGPWGEGRVTLGFAFDGFEYLPREFLDLLMQKISSIKNISCHYLRGAIQTGNQSITKKLNDLGILDNRWVVAHSSNLTQEDADIYKEHDIYVSSTPSTELQMAMGSPVVAFRDDLGITDNCSFGIDCHSCCAAFMPGEARIGLQAARGFRGEPFLAQGKQPKTVFYSVEEAFHLLTIRGARALNMVDNIGSLAEGKSADITIFSTTSPCMIAAAVHDPIAAIVLHSSPADVDTVIVDGIIRKQDGNLLDVKSSDKEGQAAHDISWAEIATEVETRREELQKKLEHLDLQAGQRGMMEAWHIQSANIVDHL